MTLFGLVALGLAPAVPGAGESAAPLAYFFYDLRWWWLVGALVLVLAEADSLAGSRPSAGSSRRSAAGLPPPGAGSSTQRSARPPSPAPSYRRLACGSRA